jgi:hypothetical protein
MPTERLLLTLGLGLTMACASPQPKTTPKPNTDKTPMMAALDGLCRQVREVAADPAICPQDRRRALKAREDFKTVFASEAGREIQGAAEAAGHGRRYAALVALADRAGQPGWQCEELHRMIDEDPAFVRPVFDSQFLRELDGYCRITEKHNREISDIGLRALAISKEVEKTEGCALKHMRELLGGLSPADKYPAMKQMAADAGKPDWQCPALDH